MDACKENPRIAIFDEMGGSGDGSAEGRANATLAAAAPDLLAALKRIVNDSPEPGEDAVLTVDGYNQACAAIAKAQGN